MKIQKRVIIIDCQIFQTPALQRGMGQYMLALINELKGQVDNNTHLLLLQTSLLRSSETDSVRECLKGIELVKLPLKTIEQTKNTVQALAHNKKVLSRWLKNLEYDEKVFVVGSLFQAQIFPSFPDGCKKLALMYDIAPLQLFQQYASRMRWDDYLTRFKLVYEANKLLCISQTTASDTAVYLGINHKKLEVINGGPGELAKETKPKIRPEGKYILMPTGNDLRKNNTIAVEAFRDYCLQHNTGHKLVITSEFTKEEREQLESISKDIFFTGVVSDSELNWYYDNCSALLFPSLHEGLGMPIIEAVLFGKPVIASTIEVFLEISETAPYYFNPYDRDSIAGAINKALDSSLTESKLKEYGRIKSLYTWANTARILLSSIDNIQESSWHASRIKIAVVGPHTTGVSAVGKFIAELHPELSQHFDVDYYYERSSSDKILRPDVLGKTTSYKSIFNLTNRRMSVYKAIIYHVGNSSHHTITTARALTKPSIVVLHDLNIENVYKDMVQKKLISESRLELEREISKHSGTQTSFISSLVDRQKAVIVHSDFAHKAVEELVRPRTKVVKSDLAVTAPLNQLLHTERPFTIGLAGILAGIKGLEVIEEIAKNPVFSGDRIMVFGVNFAEPGTLERIHRLSNVDLATNLTDYDFQMRLKQLDVFVNFRMKYQGEASYATLESMRYGVPVIVRGDFGWYSELPEGSVVKVKKKTELVGALSKLKDNMEYRQSVSEKARLTTKKIFNAGNYVEKLKEIVEGM